MLDLILLVVGHGRIMMLTRLAWHAARFCSV